MYFVLALLCIANEECMVKAYPHLLPTHESCMEVKNSVHRKLWEFAPDNAESVETWCLSIPTKT
jgi:hypothetical protein